MEQARWARVTKTHCLERESTALIVIDMQRGFLDPGASLEVPKGRAIIPNLHLMIETCRAQGVPVIFTQFVYSTAVPCLCGDPFGIEHLPAPVSQPTGLGRPSSNCLIGPNAGLGSESAEIIGELMPRPDELVIQGHTYDKFYGTPLDLALRCRGIDYLIVAGMTTEICVNCTVLAAAARNYRVTVVTDGVATVEEDVQQFCFNIWQRKFARLCQRAVAQEKSVLLIAKRNLNSALAQGANPGLRRGQLPGEQHCQRVFAGWNVHCQMLNRAPPGPHLKST
ncbi:MAG: cysteine hydrolase [Planctomycetes bacterium]|nr:cysteine hydrolase [Planctomycetota bacterium]